MSGAISVQHGAFGRAALYQLNKEIITHAHREAHLIFYVDGKEAVVQVGDQAITADKSTAVAVSPWMPHSFHPQTDTMPCICLVLYIKPMWFLENSNSANYPLSFGKAAIPMTSDVLNWVHKLINLMLEDDATDLFDGYLYEMTRICFSLSSRGVKNNRQQISTRTQFMDFRVRRSLRLMQEAYRDYTDIDWLARESGLSRPHYFKLFKKQMGVTPPPVDRHATRYIGGGEAASATCITHAAGVSG